MGIFEKIEVIREKPEHVRLRWAWGMAILVTLIIVFIWGFSLKMQNKNEKNEIISEEEKNIINGFQEESKSIKDSIGQVKNGMKEVPFPSEGF